jgi:hypothetical protein
MARQFRRVPTVTAPQYRSVTSSAVKYFLIVIEVSESCRLTAAHRESASLIAAVDGLAVTFRVAPVQHLSLARRRRMISACLRAAVKADARL